MNTFYDLTAKTPSGEKINMADYKGKPVLIVNTATQCGLTPQFEGLEKLHQAYKDLGLITLGFPCNQFAGQEPETNENMVQSCLVNHGVTFPLSEKIDVNGPNAHPIFKFLKSIYFQTYLKFVKLFLKKQEDFTLLPYLIKKENYIYLGKMLADTMQ